MSPGPEMTELGALADGAEVRILRGLALWREVRSRLDVTQDGYWLVPSETGSGRVYRASVVAGTCTCEDRKYSGYRCKHIWVAAYEEALEAAHRAAMRKADRSGERPLGRHHLPLPERRSR